VQSSLKLRPNCNSAPFLELEWENIMIEKHKHHMWTELSDLSALLLLSLTCYEVWLSQDTLIDNAKEQANSLSNMIAQATK
jgi:hypothetical protein